MTEESEKKKVSILFVDSYAFYETFLSEFQKLPHVSIYTADGVSTAKTLLKRHGSKIDIVISDRAFGGSGGERTGAKIVEYIVEKVWDGTRPNNRPLFVEVSGKADREKWPGTTAQYKRKDFIATLQEKGAAAWINEMFAMGPGKITQNKPNRPTRKLSTVGLAPENYPSFPLSFYR